MSTPAKLLIVEDDDGVSYLQSRALERSGYAVSVAATADEALRHVQMSEVDLIVLDYCLPGEITGLDLYETLKASGRDLPVIIVTGFSEEGTILKALRAGVRDFFRKTTDYLDYLPAAVERVLHQIALERRLAESEARFQSFMDNSPAVAFVKDDAGRMIYANRLCEQLFFKGAEWLGKTDAELWPTETARQLRENDLAVLAANQASEMVESVPMSDGTVRHWHTYKFPMQESSGQRCLGGMAVDITDRRAAEESLRKRDEQLRQSQKMEAVGTLAGGVAHEFNNLLQAMQGYTRYAMEDLDAGDQRYQDLEQVLKASERATMLTRQLLSFSRRQTLEFADVQLNQAVQDLMKMIRPLIGEHITVQLLLSPQSTNIHADLGHLQQVLMNLCVNARDAMPDGGTLTIKTEGMFVRDSHQEVHPDLKPGGYIVLTVADTGCGIQPQHKEHIFEPFFTTKEIGKGTGLGLAMVYGIVQQHGGLVRIYSEPGYGSTFKIFLPAVDRNVVPQVSEPIRALARGTETILVAEDEPLVRSLTVRVLQGAGYETLVAKDGEEAIQLFEANADRISLAVLDVVMPRRSGREVYERIRQLNPNTQAIFCSGYDPETGQVDFVKDVGLRLIQKPFAPEVLLQAIREVLDLEVACAT